MPIPPNPISSSRPSSDRRQLHKSYSTISTKQPLKNRPLFRRVSSSIYSSRPSVFPSSFESDPSPRRGTDCLSCPEVEQKPTSSGSDANSPNSLSSNSLSLSLVNGGWNRVIRFNWFFFYFLIFTCISLVAYSIWLWKRNAALHGEVIDLHRLCKGNEFIHSNSIEALPSRDDKSSYYFADIDKKMLAFYIVIFTVLMPFLVYKYLDYFPRLKCLSKSTENYREEVPVKKKIAYMVDVCFSVYPYAKLLALLFATVLLIGFWWVGIVCHQ